MFWLPTRLTILLMVAYTVLSTITVTMATIINPALGTVAYLVVMYYSIKMAWHRGGEDRKIRLTQKKAKEEKENGPPTGSLKV